MLKKEEKLLPPVLPIKKLIGPSFVLLGLGLGSGEIILWPYLSSNWGLGIAWGALLGLLFQFFMNMEIERYSLLRGESVFVGLARRWKVVPYWLIFSTILGFGWPGIIAASAFLIASVFGGNSTVIAIVFLILIGIILSVGKYVYNTVEKFTMILISVGVPVIFLLTFYLADGQSWQNLAVGLVGKGDGYWFLSAGIPIASFFAAFAFSGAGGNLNLVQSSYIREKGYGMGFFMPKLKGLFAAKKEEKIDLDGYEFNPSKENISRFRAWWRATNIEHFLVFFVMGLLTVSFLMLLSYVTTYGLSGNQTGINFVIHEAKAIGAKTLPAIGSAFLLMTGLMLFSTQLTVIDANSRIMSENYALIRSRNQKKFNLSKIYYFFLACQIAFGIGVFLVGFKEPLLLLTLSALINAMCMFVHIGLVNWLNHKELPEEVKPSKWRLSILIVAFVFFGFFSGFSIWRFFNIIF